MDDESLPPEPPRLAGQEGEAAELLRSADPEFQKELDESGAFRQIERLRRRRTALSWGIAGVAAAASIALFAQGAGRFGTREVTMTAEPLPPPAAPEPAPVRTADEKPAVRLEFSSQIAEFAPQARVLNTSLEPRSVSMLGVTVRLVDVAPYPKASGPPIDPGSYVVKLVASRS